MELSRIPFGITDWARVERTEHKGESGLAYWQTRSFGGIRVRMVEYTPGYVADHWCIKGHVLPCVEGELHTELKDRRMFTLGPGMSYQVETTPRRTAPQRQLEPSYSSSIEGGGFEALPPFFTY
jgi:hypothetical protein